MDKMVLSKLLDQHLSYREIAKKRGVSYTTIRYWVNKHGLKSSFKPKSWDMKKVRNAVKSSYTLSGTLKSIGLDPRGCNYKTLRKFIKELGIDTSHFTRKRQGTCESRYARPLSEILVKSGKTENTSRLKTRLLRDGLLDNLCKICKMKPTWHDKPLVLRLDHMNGDAMDHRLGNLRLVCPNCDSQLPTYCGRNMSTRGRSDKASVSKTEK